MTDAVRLNLGAGDTVIDGFTAIDRCLGTEAYPLDYADGSVDEIRASHILEHFPLRDVPAVLADWVRVLKPGGRIRIAVPDVDKIACVTDEASKILYLMGGQTDENDFHRSAFTRDLLAELMKRAGLVSIRPWRSENTDCAALPISLNLEGIKPTSATPQTVKIEAVMTLPRIGWNDAWGCIQSSLAGLGIPLRHCTGALWNQNFQTVIEQCIAEGVEWVLTLDYDSMFVRQHVEAMLAEFRDHPEYDALASLQPKRNTGEPMLHVNGSGDVVSLTDPFPVHTAHFGLTLLRTSALRDIPKPWFLGAPGADGTWTSSDHIDADSWFWKLWHEAGKTLYVMPTVRIGHLEVMVSYVDSQGVTKRCYADEWLQMHNVGRHWRS